jgi:hypothetical protein
VQNNVRNEFRRRREMLEESVECGSCHSQLGEAIIEGLEGA